MATPQARQPTLGIFGTFIHTVGSWSKTFKTQPPEKARKEWDGDAELTYDTISTYNLPIGVLRSFLKHAFKEFEEKNYYPTIKMVRSGSLRCLEK